MTARLEVRDLSAGYGDVAAVRNVSFSVGPGEVLAVLGSNGSGKTTLLLTIAGFLRPLNGEVLAAGTRLTGLSPHRVSRLGVSLIPDDRGLCFELSVAEHLRLSRQAPLSPRSRRTRRERSEDQARVLELFPALGLLLRREVGLLSGGEQQMLAFARALLLQPKVLMVDEASLGLAPQIVRELLPMIRRYAADSGAAVVIVEQHYELALEVADYGLVLSKGREVLSGTAAELLATPDALEMAYFGDNAAAAKGG
jgi:branched-chain amino acid transport system ATP-binding protein